MLGMSEEELGGLSGWSAVNTGRAAVGTGRWVGRQRTATSLRAWKNFGFYRDTKLLEGLGQVNKWPNLN